MNVIMATFEWGKNNEDAKQTESGVVQPQPVNVCIFCLRVCTKCFTVI